MNQAALGWVCPSGAGAASARTAPGNSHCAPTSLRKKTGFSNLNHRQADCCLHAGIERGTEGETLVCVRQSPRQFPLRPYIRRRLDSGVERPHIDLEIIKALKGC
jgi:hypothetical protein